MSGKSLSSSAKRIQKELAEISLEPPTNCSAGPKGDNLYEWVSTIVGPSGVFEFTDCARRGQGGGKGDRVGFGCSRARVRESCVRARVCVCV